MKIKKILSMLVVLTMVLAVVPSLGLTASAAVNIDDLTLTDWKSYVGDPVFTYPANATSLDSYGWSTESGGTSYISASGASLTVKGNANGGDTLKMSGYGAGNDIVILEFWLSRNTSNFKHEFAIRDTKDNVIETGYINRAASDAGLHSGNASHFDSVAPELVGEGKTTSISNAYKRGVKVIFVNNRDKETYSVIYYNANNDAEISDTTYNSSYKGDFSNTKWSHNYTATYNGQFDGIGSIEYYVSSGSNSTDHKMGYLQIYAGDFPKGSTPETVKAALDGITIASLAKEKVDLPDKVTDSTGTEQNVVWTSSNTEIVADNGNVVGATDKVETVTFTPSVQLGEEKIEGTAKTVKVFPAPLTGIYTYNGTNYTIGETNLLEEKLNVNFSDEDWYNGWIAGDNYSLSKSAYFKQIQDGDVSYVAATGDDGSNTNKAIMTPVEGILTEGNMYLLTFMVNDITNSSSNNQYRNVYNSNKNSGTKLIGNIYATNGWERRVQAFTASNENIFFQFSRVGGSESKPAKLTDFAIYELIPIVKVPVTVTANDAEDNKLGTVELEGYEGETVTVPEGVYVGENGHWYLDAAATSTVVENGAATVEADALTIFTFTEKQGAVKPVASYNEGNVVNWTDKENVQGLRTAYAIVTIPEDFNKTTSNLELEAYGTYNNGNSSSAPKQISIYAVAAEDIVNIDISKAEGGTDLDAAFAEATMVADKLNFADYTANKTAKTTTVNLPIGDELEAGKTYALKFDAPVVDGGIFVIKTATAKAVDKPVTVKYVTPDEKVIATEEIYSEDGVVAIPERTVYYDGKIYSIAKDDSKEATPGETVTVKAEVAHDYAATKVAYDEDSPGAKSEIGGYFAVAGGTRNSDDKMVDGDGKSLHSNTTPVNDSRYMDMTFNTPELEDGQVAILHIAAGGMNDNNGSYRGTIRLRAANGENYAYTTSWIDNSNDVKTTTYVFATPEYRTADITDLVKAAGDDAEFTIKLATSGGMVALVDHEQSAWGGKAEGYASYISIENGVKVDVENADGKLITKDGAVKGTSFYALAGDTVRVYKGETNDSGRAATIVNGEYNDVDDIAIESATTITVVEKNAIDAKLGRTADKDLSIDFILDNALASDKYTLEINTKTLTSAQLGDNTVISLVPKDSNVIYKATLKYDGIEIASSALVSLYSAVVDNLVNYTEYTTFTDPMLEKVNAVISAGGVYFTDSEALNDQTNKIVDVKKSDEDENVTYTITVKEPFAGYGIGFILYGGKVVIGSESATVDEAEEGKVYQTITLNADGTVTLEAADGYSVTLESVYIEFIETLIAESEAAGADAELDFTPEL